MLDQKYVPPRFHPVNMEVYLLVRINLIRNVRDHVGIGNERVLIPHDSHDYLRPILSVVSVLTVFYSLI